MPFVEVKEKERIKELKKNNPKFKKAWEESEEEYRLIEEMTAIRNASNLTQKELADLVGCKQQVISRVETRENKPSLRLYTQILKSLGYRLKIEKIK